MTAQDDEAAELRPFTWQLTEARADELLRRLRATRWPLDVPGVGWDRGVPVKVLRELVIRWADLHPWSGLEQRLDAASQWTTMVDGQRLHLLHARSVVPGALPLLVTHGWPGSVLDLRAFFRPLRDPGAVRPWGG